MDSWQEIDTLRVMVLQVGSGITVSPSSGNLLEIHTQAPPGNLLEMSILSSQSRPTDLETLGVLASWLGEPDAC